MVRTFVMFTYDIYIHCIMSKIKFRKTFTIIVFIVILSTTLSVICDSLRVLLQISHIGESYSSTELKSLTYGIETEELASRSYNKEPPFSYLADYKNPCWLETLTKETIGYKLKTSKRNAHHNESRQLAEIFTRRLQNDTRPWRMRCLPYFYVLGVTKSGTTDLLDSLKRHPQVRGPWVKEPMYWNKRRYPDGSVGDTSKDEFSHLPFSNYVDRFDFRAHEVNLSRAGFQHIIGEESSYTFWEDNAWQGHPGNKGLTEPKYTTAMALSAAQPRAKLIVLLRNPTDRVYSAYSTYNKPHESGSPEEFHEIVLNSTARYRTCLSSRSLRSCVFDTKLSRDNFSETHISLRGSFYAAHLREWLDVYPREQLYIIKSEEYRYHRMHATNDVLKFLGLHSLEEVQPDSMYKFNDDNGQMFISTREILDRFFEPFNLQLEILLGKKMWD